MLGAWRGVGDNPWWAIGLLLVAVIGYGFSFPFTRRYVMPLGLKSEAIVSTQLILATITLAPFFLIGGATDNDFSLAPVLSMIGLGVFGSGFAYLWNFRVMELAGSAIASSVTYLTPVVAVVMGILFLGEKITWNEPIGALVVLFGAAIAQERIKIAKR